MRITPMDIEQQEFSRSFRGYNEEEVDDFLDKIVKDYEELINENVRLNEEIEKIQEKLKEFGEIEETLRSALVNTQKSAEEMRGRVEKEAKIIIEKAEMEAKALKQQVFQKEDLLKNEIDNLRRYKFTFKEKFKSMLNLYLKMIENEDFEKEGNYEIKENEMSKEKTKNKIFGEKTDKLEGLVAEQNSKIKDTEDEQQYR
ncbi:DivIVA domain-containing protein [bacterium]|nr:DivIVA domain-containing protein [Candidatus Atribacteria bacterium]MBU4227673.1 DivIVA domain-containing protein [bacterium]MBU4361202.1 DivIVA domain-containing protein [bacterium]MBU4601658.1 DivIVA domain-containing protein [bacterium]MCG2762462.1 DivIVA domain-containing protein [Candidatus Atribacteria bacterium]